jgi:hypothetical protein
MVSWNIEGEERNNHKKCPVTFANKPATTAIGFPWEAIRPSGYSVYAIFWGLRPVDGAAAFATRRLTTSTVCGLQVAKAYGRYCRVVGGWSGKS